LRFFIEYRQRDWLEWLAITEFAINNKVHSATKILLFIAIYGRELKIGVNISIKIENGGLSFFFLFSFLILFYLSSFYF